MRRKPLRRCPWKSGTLAIEKPSLASIERSSQGGLTTNSQGRLSPQHHLQRAGKITKSRLRAYRSLRKTLRPTRQCHSALARARDKLGELTARRRNLVPPSAVISKASS